MNQMQALQHSVTGLQQDVRQFLHWLQSQSYAFTTISPTSHTAYLKRSGKTQAANLTDVFGWSLPFRSSLLPDFIFKLLLNNQLLTQKQNLWCSQIRVSSLNGHLLVHSAYPTAEENAVFFGPDTYRFIYALQHHLNQHRPAITRAIELCSGAAPATISLAHYAPKAEIFAADINPLALTYGAINSSLNGAEQVQAIHSNLLQQVEGQFDLITANPPYLVDRHQRLYRHGGELLGAELALNIVKQSLPRLSVHGTLLLYTGVVIAHGKDLLQQAVQQHLAEFGVQFSFNYQLIDPDIFADELNEQDYPGAERIAAVVLTISRNT